MPTKEMADARELLRDRDHAEDCPGSRAETYVLPVPPDQGGGYKRVTRCIDCGGQRAERI